jgi:hypothetical protein
MNRDQSTICERTVLAAVSLVAGWTFYVLTRAYDPTRILDQAFVTSVSYSGFIPGFLQSTPTLLHALCLAFMFSIVCVRRSSFWLMWGISTFGYELLQAALPKIGAFDILDLLSIGLVLPVCRRLSGKIESQQLKPNSKLKQPLALIFAAASSIASGGKYDPPSLTHIPICMSAEEFRSSFMIDVPQTIKRAGKIHLNGDLLLVSEPFEGIHVFDNTDPSKPVAAAFIRIPGNTDMVMKDNMLYVDSAVDLLSIKFQGNNAALVNRLENVFSPRTPSDFSTKNVFVSQQEMEKCASGGGVVVGFIEKKDGDEFEKKIEENKK